MKQHTDAGFAPAHDAPPRAARGLYDRLETVKHLLDALTDALLGFQSRGNSTAHLWELADLIGQHLDDVAKLIQDERKLARKDGEQ